nr:MAG TPA: hypothetical protein [Caudoviricetes sp.]
MTTTINNLHDCSFLKYLMRSSNSKKNNYVLYM